MKTHQTGAEILAVLGFGIALWITLFQTGVISHLWDPFFGINAEKVVSSRISRALPIPDAALGALAYGTEFILGYIGRGERYRSHPKLALIYGGLAIFMGLVSIFLVFAQLLVFRAWCTLCLGSALVSFLLLGLVLSPTRLAWHDFRTGASVA